MTTEVVDVLCNEHKTSSYSEFDKSNEERLINDTKSLGLFKWPTIGNYNEMETFQTDLPNLKENVIRKPSEDFPEYPFESKNPWLGGQWPKVDVNSCQTMAENKGPKDITQEVHRRLQEQLALKQREVQEIQDKIAKNKKWGDPRKGAPDKHKSFPKPSVGKPCPPCPPINFPVSDFDPTKGRKRERIHEHESNLNPNSPCFYPSKSVTHFSVQDEYLTGNIPSETHSKSEPQNVFNPFYPNDEMSLQTRHQNFASVDNSMSTAKIPQAIKNSMLGFQSNSQERKIETALKSNFNHKWESGKYKTSIQKPQKNGYFVTKGSSHLNNGNRFKAGFTNTTRENISLSDRNQQTEDNSNNYEEFKSHSSYDNYHDGFPNSQYGPVSHQTNTDSSEDGRMSKFNLKGRSTVNFVANHDDTFNARTYNQNSGRLRIVRKRRPEMNRGWRADDCQQNSSIIYCPSCKLHNQWPHIISCCHSFCLSCLVKNLDETQGTIKCPTCSTETQLNGNSVEDLHLDFLWCKTMQAKQMNPFSCMLCSVDKQATTYCRECMQYICPDCKIVHERNLETSSHELSIVKKVKEIDGQFVETCADHPDRILENYCEECKKLVCVDCTSLGQFHNDHHQENMTRLYPTAVSKIKIMSTQLDRMRNEVQKRIQPLTILKQDIETSIRLCKQDIHKYSNFLLTETEKCRSKARLLIDKKHEDFAEENEIAQDLMVQYLSEYSPLSDFFRRYRSLASPQEFMYVASTIQEKMLKLKSKHDELQQYENIFAANVYFKSDYAGVNEYLQTQYNGIKITENLSDALPSDNSELGRRIDQDILAAIQRHSIVYSPPTSGSSEEGDSKSDPSSLGENYADPQSEMFNYNRTSISFIHEFGKYGRGDYEFVEPSGVLYLLDGSLAVCDTANHRIMVYDDHFKYVRTIGQPPNLLPLRDKKEQESRNERHLSRTPNCLYFPYRIAQCPQTENIVVIERPPSRDIQIFSVFGQFITCFGSDILQHPRGVAVDEHGVIVTVEGRTMKLMLFSQEGKLLHRFYLSVHLEFPNDVAARDGLIYISDNRGHCVHVFDYNAEPKHTIGNESVTYYPIGVSLTHLNQVVVTDNHNTFNISVFDVSDGRYLFGFKSRVRHANCYNVAVHPHRLELAVTSRENQVVIFMFDNSMGKGEGEMTSSVFEK